MLTCKRCGSTVTLGTPAQQATWGERGALLFCDGCGESLGPLKRAVAYVGARQ